LPSKILLAEGAPEGALDSLRELAKLYPSTSDYYGYYYRETLARACWKSGRLQEAVDTYLDLLKIFGGHAISRYELGQVYEQLGSIAEAKREYKKFLEMCSLADEGWHPVEDARRRLAAL